MKARVSDPLGLVRDAALPFAARALDPVAAEPCLRAGLGGRAGALQIRAVRVVRHKPGRRCLIEYELLDPTPGAEAGAVVVLGKMRARGADVASHALQSALWTGAFGPESDHGASVPEPLGVVPELGMWLQRRVPGTVATEVLLGPGGAELAGRIGEALHRLHQAELPTKRRHTPADEMAILRDRLSRVVARFPHWTSRLARVTRACERIVQRLEPATLRGIHRDFYSDQVLAAGDRLYLLDFDLYCQGPPALDLGNAIGHLVELSLRVLERPDALDDRAAALVEGYYHHAPRTDLREVEAYTTLTLARHIYLSTLFPDRSGGTERLLELCEDRLAPL